MRQFRYVLLPLILMAVLGASSASAQVPQRDSLSLLRDLETMRPTTLKDVPAAAGALSSLLAEAHAGGYTRIEMLAYKLRSYLFFKTKEYPQALQDLKRAEDIAKTLEEKSVLRDIRVEKAAIYVAAGDINLAAPIYKALIEETADDEEKGEYYFALAEGYFALDSLDAATSNSRLALRHFANKGTLSHRARVELLLGEVSLRRGNTKEAIQHFAQAKDLFAATGDTRRTADVMQRLSQVYSLNDKPKMAMQELKNVPSTEVETQINSLINRGDVQVRAGQFRQALTFYNRAYSEAQQNNLAEQKYIAGTRLTQVYMRLKNNEKALEFFSSSVTLQNALREEERQQRENSLRLLYASESEKARLSETLARQERELAQTKIQEAELRRVQDSIARSAIIERLRSDSLRQHSTSLERQMALEKLILDSTRRSAELLTVQNELLREKEAALESSQILDQQRNRILGDSLRLTQKSLDSLAVQQELADKRQQIDSLRSQRLVIAGSAVIALAFALAIFFFIRSRIIQRSEQEVRRQKEEALRQKELVEQKNIMIEENKRFLVEAEKMAALGRQSAAFSHELNTPLGVAKSAASHLHTLTDELQEKFSSNTMKRTDLSSYLGDAAEGSAMILSNLDRAVHLVDGVKKTAVAQHSDTLEKLQLAPFFAEIVESLLPQFKNSQHSINIDIDPQLALTTYSGAWYQILSNLIANSIKHGFQEFTEAGTISISASQENSLTTIRYKDNGRGATSEVASRIFDMFYTTAQSHGGSGIGMHIVYNLITQKMKGTITCITQPGEGIEFVIELPNNIAAG